MEIRFSLEHIDSAAQKILASHPEKIILFNGEMGAGKTTLIKAICKALGVNDTTASPTFSLVNEYLANNGQTVYHFDVYRLRSETEALDMGIEEYLYSGNWCFIEWAEKISSLLPANRSVLEITEMPDGMRKVTLE
ncbi:MAG: tRNA (adenosine(37)-N6)-threonylcarbamoyltransferase complex ATPase subunit type 1 TsaE [Flavobacterium sp.]|nr:MAG: tRNA (adenosine(37)-N6)-threonylcarbamoyltransferase complex ATPase subunit type 1 TsaE [Flavobacterium sp.]